MASSEWLDLWLAGDRDSWLLLGLQPYWWARIAKVVQFFAASVILVDLVGVERIREIGGRLQQAIPVSMLSAGPRWSRSIFRWIGDSFGGFYSGGGGESKTVQTPVAWAMNGKPLAYEERANPAYSAGTGAPERWSGGGDPQPWYAFVWAVPGLAGLAAWTYLFAAYLQPMVSPVTAIWMIWFFLAPPVFFLSSFAFFFLIACLWQAPFFVVRLLVISPLGKLLGSPQVERIALSVSFLLLILSSILDLAVS